MSDMKQWIQLVESSVNEDDTDIAQAKLEGLTPYAVYIRNNYYDGKYYSVNSRPYYYVLAGSEQEAKQVVLDNADTVLQHFFTTRNKAGGRPLLSKRSALPIADKNITSIEPTSKRLKVSMPKPRPFLTPNGTISARLENGELVSSEVNEAKKLGSKVTVTKGKHKGKTGVVRQIQKGRFGAPSEKRLDLDFDDGTQGVVDHAHTKNFIKSTVEESAGDEVTDIIMKTGGFAKLGMYADGEAEFLDSPMHNALYDYYADEMPYGVAKGDDGTSDEWIMDRLDQEGILDQIDMGDEMAKYESAEDEEWTKADHDYVQQNTDDEEEEWDGEFGDKKSNDKELDEGIANDVFQYLYKVTGNFLDKLPVIGDKRHEKRLRQEQESIRSVMTDEKIDQWFEELTSKLKTNRSNPRTVAALKVRLDNLRLALDKVKDARELKTLTNSMRAMRRAVTSIEKYVKSSNANYKKQQQRQKGKASRDEDMKEAKGMYDHPVHLKVGQETSEQEALDIYHALRDIEDTHTKGKTALRKMMGKVRGHAGDPATAHTAATMAKNIKQHVTSGKFQGSENDVAAFGHTVALAKSFIDNNINESDEIMEKAFAADIDDADYQIIRQASMRGRFDHKFSKEGNTVKFSTNRPMALAKDLESLIDSGENTWYEILDIHEGEEMTNESKLMDEFRKLAGLAIEESNISDPYGYRAQKEDNTNITFSQTKRVGDGTVTVSGNATNVAELIKLMQMAGLNTKSADRFVPSEPEPEMDMSLGDGCSSCDSAPEEPVNLKYSTDKSALADMIRAKLMNATQK